MDLAVDLQSYGIYGNYMDKTAGIVDYSPLMQRLSKGNQLYINTEDQQESPEGERRLTEEVKSDPEEDEFHDCISDDKLSTETLVKCGSMPQTAITMAFGNKKHHESKIKDKNVTDLKMELDVQEIEIIYRAEILAEVSRFFKVKKLTDRTKLIARAKYEQLNNQVSQITDALEKDYKNNDVVIRVAAPRLVIPFEQKSWEKIYQSECWLFTMGDFSFQTYHDKGFEQDLHEAFCLKVDHVKFEHTNSYCKWKDEVSKGHVANDQINTKEMVEKRAAFEKNALAQSVEVKTEAILKDFSTTVIFLKKRAESEMLN